MAMAAADDDNNDLGDVDDSTSQACYVLHAAPSAADLTPRKPGRPARNAGDGGKEQEGRRGGSPSSLPAILKDEPPLCGLWRKRAFDAVWGRLETLIQATLDEQNEASFKEIKQWVCNRQFYDAQEQLYRSAGIAPLDNMAGPETSTSGSHVFGSFNKQLHTALLFLGGVDPSDHQGMFDGLSRHLKSQNCHVARLLPHDFPGKCQIAVPLNSLMRQFAQMNPETADMEILTAWYSEPKNHGRPVVISVENMERCNVTALSELIVLLSEWSAEIPMVLVLGVATTPDVLQRFLPSNALSRLIPQCFTLKAPLERLESVVRAALVDSFSAFEINNAVAQHLHTFFTRHDLTVTSFIMSLKVACMEHFCNEPLSFLSEWLLKCPTQSDLEKQCAVLPDGLLKYAASLPSVESIGLGLGNVSTQLSSRLWVLKEQKQLWSIALLCAYEVGKQSGLGFTDLFCDALYPNPMAKNHLDSANPLDSVLQKSMHLRLGWQELKARIRELTLPVLRSILEEWKLITSAVTELHAEICCVYTKILSGSRVDCQNTLTPASTGRSGTNSSVSNTSHTLDHRVLNKSPLRRPLFIASEENFRSPLQCTSTKASHIIKSSEGSSPRLGPLEGSRRMSTRLLTSPEKASPSSRLPESPKRKSARLLTSPEKASPSSHLLQSPKRTSTRLLTIADSASPSPRLLESPRRASNELPESPEKTRPSCSLPESPQRTSARHLKTPPKGTVAFSLQESPRRNLSRLLRSPEKVFTVSSLPESPRRVSARLLKSPDETVPPSNGHGSPRRTSTRLLNSPGKASQVPAVRGSPRKSPKSPAKTTAAVSVRESPRKKLLKSPGKKTTISGAAQGQQAMSRSELRKETVQYGLNLDHENRPHQHLNGERMASINSSGGRAGINPLNELVADLLERIILRYLVPSETLPYHEIICFKNVSSLKQAMTGATRQKVQLDLLGSQLRLQCECCHNDGSLSNTMHDTCLSYHLSQEHGELINVHDWYQSFSSICCPTKLSGKKKGKRRKLEPSVTDTATMQARFTRAATELQIAGLLRMPKKGRPDFSQRVGFG